MKSALFIAIALSIALIVTTINAQKSFNGSTTVAVTSLLEPSLSVDSFDSRYLIRSNDTLTLYPTIESFYTMGTIYE